MTTASWEYLMDAKNTHRGYLVPVTKLGLVATMAGSGLLVRMLTPSTDLVLSAQWVLLNRLSTAVMAAALLYGSGADKPIAPEPHSRLRKMTLAALAVMVPCAVGLSPAIEGGGLRVVAVPEVLGALLALIAVWGYALVVGLVARSRALATRGRLLGTLVSLPFVVMFFSQDWLIRHGIEGPAVVLRPVGQALALGHAPLLLLAVLAASAIAMLHQLVHRAQAARHP
jgi:voltage-gated potassium channel Kch